MSDLIKYGAIAIGGYLLLEHFGLMPSLFASNVVPVTPVVTGGSGQPVVVAPTDMSKLKALIQAQFMRVGGTQDGFNQPKSVDVWNTLYVAVRGVPGPAPETIFPNVNRDKLYTIDEYLAGMGSGGFSGMGMIAHHVNPYANPMGGSFRFGDNIRPSGMEMYVKRF